jgi:hypothetical protein
MPEQWKREQTERDRRHLLRKMTSQADNRMRTRTAKGQRANALDALKAPDDVPLRDADDESTTRAGVLL